MLTFSPADKEMAILSCRISDLLPTPTLSATTSYSTVISKSSITPSAATSSYSVAPFPEEEVSGYELIPSSIYLWSTILYRHQHITMHTVCIYVH